MAACRCGGAAALARSWLLAVAASAAAACRLRPRGGVAAAVGRLIRSPNTRKIPAPSGVSSRPDTSVTSDGSGGERRRLGRIEEARDPIHAVAGHAANHLLVGGRPGVAAAAGGGRFFAGDAQRPALVGVVDVPDPGERGLVALDQRGDIAADAVGRGAVARHHGDLPRAGFVVEVARRACGTLRAAGRRSIQRRRSMPDVPGGAGEARTAVRRQRRASGGAGSQRCDRKHANRTRQITPRRAPRAPDSTPLHQRPPACRRHFCYQTASCVRNW